MKKLLLIFLIFLSLLEFQIVYTKGKVKEVKKILVGTNLQSVNNTLNNDSKASIVKPIGEVINVITLGAKGDGLHNDTNIIQNAINYGHTVNKPIYFPSGTYKISNSINVPTNSRIYGDGKTHTIIKVSTSMKSIFVSNGNNKKGKGNYFIEILDIGFDGNKLAASGIEFNFTRESVIKDCRITGCQIGFKSSINCWSNSIINSQIKNNSNTNILLNSQANDFNILNCQLDYAGNYGIYINGDCQMVNIMGCVIQNCGKDGILANGGRALNIDACYFESNNNKIIPNCADLNFSGASSIITGLKISGCEIITNKETTSILLDKVRGCTILATSIDYLDKYITQYSVQTSAYTKDVFITGVYTELPFNDIGNSIFDTKIRK